jgi:hypothetical protein
MEERTLEEHLTKKSPEFMFGFFLDVKFKLVDGIVEERF